MSENKTQTKKNILPTGPGYLEVIIIVLLLSALAVAGYDRLFAQKIRVIDLKGYLRTQKALLVAGEITEQQWDTSLDSVEQALNREAANRNHIIVLKEVVLRNGEEISIR
ncbi:hypothetical protein KKC22_20685 [Myxococcota bacterium]|nr:hypothetical protein [Myxococcota bacterium]